MALWVIFSELTWLGLILFRNELKPDTADAILALKEGNVRCVMITGDNAQVNLTYLTLVPFCQIVPYLSHVCICHCPVVRLLHCPCLWYDREQHSAHARGSQQNNRTC